MSDDLKKSRNRSPNYPYLSLPDAISKTCVVLDKDKLNPTSPEIIVGHLGYSNLNGTSRRVISAMKEYGLLEEVGGKRYKVSNLGYRLCKNNEDSKERERLLKEAARKPYFFNFLIEEYKGDLPSPESLEDYLVLHKEFAPDGARTLQKVLRETIEFANISSNDFNETSQDAEKTNIGQSSPNRDIFSNFFSSNSKSELNAKPDEQEQKPLFKYSVPLSIQRSVNAQLVITGESLKKRDLEVLAKKVGDLVDAFEEEEPKKESSPQSSFDFE